MRQKVSPWHVAFENDDARGRRDLIIRRDPDALKAVQWGIFHASGTRVWGFGTRAAAVAALPKIAAVTDWARPYDEIQADEEAMSRFIDVLNSLVAK